MVDEVNKYVQTKLAVDKTIKESTKIHLRDCQKKEIRNK